MKNYSDIKNEISTNFELNNLNILQFFVIIICFNHKIKFGIYCHSYNTDKSNLFFRFFKTFS